MQEKIKILILEDNEYDSELIKHELKTSHLNISTETVSTRGTYESSLEYFGPDLILSDYSLPAFDGVAAFHFKELNYPDIPFIIVSGTIGEENAVELIKNGVTDYVLKDKLGVLNQKILRALEEARIKKERIIAEQKLKLQNEKLFEIAFLQSHQVRGPIANVLGLINLFNHQNPNDPMNTEVIRRLQTTTEAFDKVIRQIIQKTHEIENQPRAY
jgi:DNA-binding NtrC family response regulator